MAASSTLAPPAFPAELHAGNRERLIAALRAQLFASGRPLHGLAFLQVRSLSVNLSRFCCFFLVHPLICVILSFCRVGRSRIDTAPIT
jgi:hypothetical protein